jgi:hypothetical protein
MNQNDIGTPIALTGVGVIIMGIIYLILKSYCNDRINTMRFNERFARRFEIQEKHLHPETMRSLRRIKSLQELKSTVSIQPNLPHIGFKISSPQPDLDSNIL